MSDAVWQTAVTKVEPNKIRLRGYAIDELMGRVSFAEAICLALTGDLPSPAKASLLNAIFVASIDHGVTPPSCQTARLIASTGAPPNAALAGGILSINKFHGGAIEDAMGIFHAALDMQKQESLSVEQAAEKLVADYRSRKKRLSGFGHRYHTQDPRTVMLFKLAREAGMGGPGMQTAAALEDAIEKSLGKRLPLNVDGAIGALLCDLEIPSELANAFFMIARLPGLVAHVFEERTRMRPMRHINSREHEYDGPPDRKLAD